jgi:hypothetical protein
VAVYGHRERRGAGKIKKMEDSEGDVVRFPGILGGIKSLR